MNNTSPKRKNKFIVVFGAGKIGRSFIGQLFNRNSYDLIFVDKNRTVVDALNRRKEYRVVVKADPDYDLVIKNFSAIHFDNKKAILKVLSETDIVATCVGKNAFEPVMIMIAEGLAERFRIHPDKPLDIILGENIIDAGRVALEIIKSHLPEEFPVSSFAGLIETSLGKMVPIIPAEQEKKDPLIVFAESYNTLILDKKGFKNPAPDFPGLQLVENIEAWVYRKALIHNLGHVAVAYSGYYYNPRLKLIADVLELPGVYSFGREVMSAAAQILVKAYPGEFTLNDLHEHIDELLLRFKNRALGDTVFRVGCDLLRKFGPSDRIFGAITLGLKYQMPIDAFCRVAAFGLFFRATDEDGQSFEGDREIFSELDNYPVQFLCRASGLTGNHAVIDSIMKTYAELHDRKKLLIE